MIAHFSKKYDERAERDEGRRQLSDTCLGVDDTVDTRGERDKLDSSQRETIAAGKLRELVANKTQTS